MKSQQPRSSQADDVKQEQALRNPQGIVNSGSPSKRSTSLISDKRTPGSKRDRDGKNR